ncbi:MAG: ABC transporter ATP-binding protein/permease [Rickettsiales bacterium]|jgi:subfamily B ATP-binding cassette protein MsbA|nr:ABC transporter ATP-binding protein/permease [Rickettsiales bacterium]
MRENPSQGRSGAGVVARIVREYVYPYLPRLIVAAILMLLAAAGVAYRAYLIKPAVDRIFVRKDLTALYMIPVKLILVAIVCCLSSYFENLIVSDTSSRILTNLQMDMFSKLLHRDIDFYQKQSPSRIGDYLVDAHGVNRIIDIVLGSLLLQFFTIVALIAVMTYQNPILSLVSLVAFPLIIFPLIGVGKKTKELADAGRERFSNVVSSMAESFNNIRVIKSNSREEDEIARTGSILEKYRRTAISLAKKSLMVSPTMEMISVIAFALVILYSGTSIIDGKISAGDFFTFVTAMFSAYKPAKSLTNLNLEFQNALASAKRYFTILDQSNMVVESPSPILLENIRGDIKFNAVRFRYPNSSLVHGIYSAPDCSDDEIPEDYAIDNLDIAMSAGKSYALVGPSGSGKSTIFNLLLRFYDVTSGSIDIDGVNIMDLGFRNLRNSISMVSQDVRLFDISILENIRYTKKDATLEEVVNVARMANVDEFAGSMPNGYNTVVGHDGTLLSGGQKQRISIARALLKNTPILLLDEATSALDPISENLIQKSLKILMSGKTTVIIAHRLATIMNCDHIFVLEKGKLVEEGNHDGLIAMDGVYKSFCDKQFYSKK